MNTLTLLNQLLDVVKPELYWIQDQFGARCYRRNVPSFVQNFGVQAAPISIEGESSHLRLAKCGVSYDGDEPPCGAADEEIDNYDITHNEKFGNFTTSISVAKEYFKHIIGRQAETKKRLENQTRTRIDVPKIGQDGPIVITGQSREDVASCRRRIEQLVDSARQRQPFTHFISLPFNSDDIKQNFEDFKKAVLEECSESRGVDPSIFQTAECLHLTIGMLVLLSNEERTLAKQTLERCREEIVIPHLKGIKTPLKAHLENLNYMNDDPSDVHVLYGTVSLTDGCEDDVLQSLANKIVDYFVLHGVMPKKQYDSVKLHVTLMNTRYRSNEDDIDEEEANGNGQNKSGGFGGRNGEGGYARRESFDARLILEKFSNYDFGEQVLKEIHISGLHSRRSDGYYSSTAMVEMY